MGNRDTAIQGTSAAEKAAFTQDYTPNALQQYSTVAHGRVVEITGEAAEGAVVALRIDEGTPFNVDRTLPENQTGDYNSFRYLHTVKGADARWVKVEFTVTLGAAVTLRRGFVYVPPANEAPQYDLDGNLIDDGRWVYTWDAENRLTSMTQKVIPVAAGVSTPPERTRLEFAYDYKNRRIAKKVFQLETSNLAPATWRLVKDLRFVYDGYQMIAELDATFATGTGVAGITPSRGVVRTYLWGPDVSGTMTGAGGVGGLLAFTFQGDSYYPISDANGNITAIHAPGIDQVIRFDYDPFGNRLTNTGPDVEICPMGFSSKYTDSETGLVDYGLRIYSPPMARFLSRDPIEERGGINLYGFVGNDPVNFWDYLGLRGDPPIGGKRRPPPLTQLDKELMEAISKQQRGELCQCSREDKNKGRKSIEEQYAKIWNQANACVSCIDHAKDVLENLKVPDCWVCATSTGYLTPNNSWGTPSWYTQWRSYQNGGWLNHAVVVCATLSKDGRPTNKLVLDRAFHPAESAPISSGEFESDWDFRFILNVKDSKGRIKTITEYDDLHQAIAPNAPLR